MDAWRALDKVTPFLNDQYLPATTKVRRDKIDKIGCSIFLYRSRIHHIGPGRAHSGKRVLILMGYLEARGFGLNRVVLRPFELDASIDYERSDQNIVTF